MYRFQFVCVALLSAGAAVAAAGGARLGLDFSESMSVGPIQNPVTLQMAVDAAGSP